MDPIDALLLDGESVLWRGAPNYEKAKPSATGWRAQAPLFAWAFGLTLAIVGLIFVGQEEFAHGILQTVLPIAVVVLLLALVLVVLAATLKRVSDRPDERYAITSRRLILVGVDGARASLLPMTVLRIETRPNGGVHDLVVCVGYGEGDFVTLRALDDATGIERLILESFGTTASRDAAATAGASR